VSYLVAFAASFVYICLKAMQQINVVRDAQRWILPTSLGMTACEFYIVGYIAAVGPTLLGIMAIGIGSGLGCLLAMRIHRK
jgi:hypothetical protein